MIHATFTEARLKSWLMSSQSDCGRQLEGEQIYCSSVGKLEFLGGLLFNSNCSDCKASNPLQRNNVLYFTKHFQLPPSFDPHNNPAR